MTNSNPFSLQRKVILHFFQDQKKSRLAGKDKVALILVVRFLVHCQQFDEISIYNDNLRKK